MSRFLRRMVLSLAIVLPAAPAAAADPILMFIFSVAREMMEKHAAREAEAKPLPHMGSAVPELPKVYPGTMVEPEHLRALIDDCFPYLSEDRRAEVFESLHAALIDPKNAPMRAALIDHFAEKAFAVKAAQQRLQKMSRREKELLAGEFKKAVDELPPEEQAKVGRLLREGLLPVPSDFNQMLLGVVQEKP